MRWQHTSLVLAAASANALDGTANVQATVGALGDTGASGTEGPIKNHEDVMRSLGNTNEMMAKIAQMEKARAPIITSLRCSRHRVRTRRR
jgi:hypothetical protein